MTGFTIGQTGVTPGTDSRYLIKGVIDPRDYGALGDGTTDDSTSLINALNAAKLTGATVYLAAGKTYYAPTLTVSTTSAQTLRIASDPSAPAVLDLGQATPVPGAVGTGTFVLKGPVYIENLQIKNANRVIDYSLVDNSVSRVWLRNLVVTNVGQFLYANQTPGTSTNGFKRLVVHGCEVVGARRGIDLQLDYMQSVSITSCRFEDITDTTYGTSANNGAVAFAINLGQDWKATQDAGTDNTWTIRDCKIKNVKSPNGDATWTAANGIRCQSSNRVVVDGNHIEDLDTGDGLNCEGIYLKCYNYTVSNNTLLNAGRTQGFMALKGEAREAADQGAGTSANKGLSYNGIIRDNILQRTDGKSGPGMYINHGQALIAGNVFDGFVAESITSDPAGNVLRDLVIEQNRFYGSTFSSANLFAINITSPFDGLRIVGNIFDNFALGSNIGGAIQLLTQRGSKVQANLYCANNKFSRFTGTNRRIITCNSAAGSQTNFKFVNNEFTTAHEQSIRAGGSSTGSASNWAISGNDFSGCSSAVNIITIGSTLTNAGTPGLNWFIDTNNVGFTNEVRQSVTTDGTSANLTHNFTKPFGLTGTTGPTVADAVAFPTGGSPSAGYYMTASSSQLQVVASIGTFTIWAKKTRYDG